MGEVRSIATASPRLAPLRVINPSEWIGREPAERQWLIKDVCVRGGVTLLNGDGGVGKSLLCLQLQAALALGQKWVGIDTPAKTTRSLGIYCEDEPDELHRRMADIARYYGCRMQHFADAALMVSRVGENNTLMSFDRRNGGPGQVTNFFRQVESLIEENAVELVIIDTAADTFGGFEIDREQVRTFVQRLRAWALKSRGAVIITQHPSVAGMASGAGSSGSTGWHNSVRSRVYLTSPRRVDDEGDEIPTDERFLKFMKSNYGPKGGKLRLMWKEGVFVPSSEADAVAIVDELRVRDILLDVAGELVRTGAELSADIGAKSGLIAKARSNATLSRLPQIVLQKAQEALIERGDLVVVKARKTNRHVAALIRPTWLTYPGEVEGNP